MSHYDFSKIELAQMRAFEIDPNSIDARAQLAQKLIYQENRAQRQEAMKQKRADKKAEAKVAFESAKPTKEAVTVDWTDPNGGGHTRHFHYVPDINAVPTGFMGNIPLTQAPNNPSFNEKGVNEGQREKVMRPTYSDNLRGPDQHPNDDDFRRRRLSSWRPPPDRARGLFK